MDEQLYKRFSKNLRIALAAAKKTQADLAKYMQVSTATASDWCNDKQIPRADKLQRICNWLGLELSDLLVEYRGKKETIDADVLQIAQAMKDNKILPSAFSGLSAEDLQRVADFAEALKKTYKG